MTLGLISDRGRETIMHFAGALLSRAASTCLWSRLCPMPARADQLRFTRAAHPIIPHLPAVSITYSVVALGLMSTVGALPTFGRDRVVFFRESAAGERLVGHCLPAPTHHQLACAGWALAAPPTLITQHGLRCHPALCG